MAKLACYQRLTELLDVPVAPVCYISAQNFSCHPDLGVVVNISSQYNENERPSQHYGYRHHPTHFFTAGSSRNIQELTYCFPFFLP